MGIYVAALGIVRSFRQLGFLSKHFLIKLSEIATEVAKNPAIEEKEPSNLESKKGYPILHGSRSDWYAPYTLRELIKLKKLYPDAKIVVGNTEVGIEQRFLKNEYSVLINPTKVPHINEVRKTKHGIKVGGGSTLTQLHDQLKDLIKKRKLTHKNRIYQAFSDQLELFSGPSIRNAASLAGNIMTASPISDLNTLLIAVNAEFTLNSLDGGIRVIPAREFFLGYRQTAARPDEILQYVYIRNCEVHCNINLLIVRKINMSSLTNKVEDEKMT